MISVDIASQHGQEDLLEYLLKRGVRVNDKTGNSTPLLHACTGGHTGVVRRLIASGAGVNAINNQGMSLLCWQP